MNNNPSFADFEDESSQDPGKDKWPLDEWYESIRKVPISELSPGDLATALRQGICVDSVVSPALKSLKADPLAGALYEGELVVALKSVPKDYWMKNVDAAKDLREIVNTSFAQFDDDVKQDAKELLSKLPQ